MKRWAGIDVGGRRKGFHGAAVDLDGLIDPPRQMATPAECIEWLHVVKPRVIAVDSPRTCAPDGKTCREGERALAGQICGIRWTPAQAKLSNNPYYEWIEHGLELYELLRTHEAELGWQVIEVFPTASWTVWAGRRGSRSRARWSAAAFADLKLDGLPSRRLNQDDRDAIAAALTARLYPRGTRAFGEIIVPKPGLR
jgi:predicted nuclease with RNAse H fold